MEQEKSFIEKLMASIALKQNKPIDSFKKFMIILEDNWLDSKEALEQTNEQELIKLGIPLGLAKVILQIIQKNEVQENIHHEIKEEQFIQEQLQQIQMKDSQFDEEVNKLLVELKRKAITLQQFMPIVQTLDGILGKIINNPSEQKFRQINTESKAFMEKFNNNPEAFQLLQMAGFQSDSGKYIIIKDHDVNTKKLERLNDKIHQFTEKLSFEMSEFNPFSSSVKTVDNQQEQIKQIGAPNFLDEIERIKKERRAQLQPITNKPIKIFRISNETNWRKYQEKMQNENDEVQVNQSDALKKAILTFDKWKDQTQFQSKSKKELDQLLKTPFYQEAIIRIKFPNGDIFETVFAPIETVQNVYDTLKKALFTPNEPFYIYMTPPIQKLGQKQQNTTLEQLKCVPFALFYFSFENQNFNQTKQFFKEELMKNITFM